MGKKNKKPKKVSAKKEKYAKFRREKPSTLTFNPPDLTAEQQAQRQEDEKSIATFLRYRQKIPRREISERKLKSKR